MLGAFLFVNFPLSLQRHTVVFDYDVEPGELQFLVDLDVSSELTFAVIVGIR